MTAVDALDASPTSAPSLQLCSSRARATTRSPTCSTSDADAVRGRAPSPPWRRSGPATAGLTASGRARGRRLPARPAVRGRARRPPASYLAGSAAGRAWARGVAAELRPLGGTRSPRDPRRGARCGRRRPRPRHGGEPAARATGPRRASRVRRGSSCSRAWPSIAAAVRRDPARARGGSDDSASHEHERLDARPASPRQQHQQAQTSAQPTPIAQINLHAANGSGAVGVAQVLRHRQPARAWSSLRPEAAPSTKKAPTPLWLYTSQSQGQAPRLRRPSRWAPSGKLRRTSSPCRAGAAQYKRARSSRSEQGNPKQPEHDRCCQRRC